MKRFIILLAAVATLLTATAQNYERYYNRPFAHLGLTIGGGLGSMVYDNPAGKGALGLCLDFGLHYTHFFSSFGVGVGIHISSMNAGAKYNFEEVTTNHTHANNPYALYDLTTSFNDWHERQTITTLGVPVEVFYRLSLGGGRHFIAGLGLMADLPMRGRYSSAGGDYTTTGFFHVAHPHSISDMPEHGFSTYDETFGAQITDLKMGFSVLADLGVHLPLGYSGGLYVGLFGSFGLSSILDAAEGTMPMLEINSSDATVIDYHGTFAALGNPSLHLLRIGIKVGIDIGSPMDN